MSWLGALKTAGKGLLKQIPGAGLIITALETASEVAEAMGGTAGDKIAKGAKDLAEGLEEAGRQALPPDVQLKLAEVKARHEERMAELEGQDIQGGRDLAIVEIASQDAFVRRTRPWLLRVYGFAAIGLVLLCVVLAFVAVFWTRLDPVAAGFLGEVVTWAVASIVSAFVLMFRAYVDRRTTEKLAEVGMRPEGLVDKLIKLKAGR